MMPRFRLLRGSHQEKGSNEVLRAGAEFDSPNDLTRLFGPEKFERLPDPRPNAPAPPVQLRVGVETSITQRDLMKKAQRKGSSALGDEVTDEFEFAVAAKLRVFQRGRWFWVASPEDLDTPLHEKALARTAVDGWVDEYIDGQDRKEATRKKAEALFAE